MAAYNIGYTNGVLGYGPCFLTPLRKKDKDNQKF
jgi:hypothetical protein